MVIHTFDNQEVQASPWLPCAAPQWCAGYGDRWAASIVYEGNVALYSGTGRGGGGLIFRPQLNSVLCSYATDGGSMQVTCGDTDSDPALDDARNCIPGCHGGSAAKPWCDRSESNLGLKAGSCAFRPADLDDMMWTHKSTHRGYNEVIIDARVYRAHLPLSLEAVLGDREVHAAFLRRYPHLSAHDVPLVNFAGHGFALA